MKVDIWIVDSEIEDKNEALGIKSDAAYQLTPLYFRKSELTCFWIDVEKNTETGSRDIFFSIGSVSYRTPYRKDLAEAFLDIINFG